MEITLANSTIFEAHAFKTRKILNTKTEKYSNLIVFIKKKRLYFSRVKYRTRT